MPRSLTPPDVGVLWLVLLMSLTGCSTVCQRCVTDDTHPVPTASTLPSRAEQEIWAQRTWAAFVEHRALHEARATQVAAIDAAYGRLVHLPRVSLQVSTPISLATALRLLVAETGYSVVYGVGVDTQRAVTPAFVHQRLDAASDVLVRPLGYRAQLNTRDRQITIDALMTRRWHLPAEDKDEAWWNAVRIALERTLAAEAATAATSGTSLPMTSPRSTVMVDRATGTIAVSAPVPRMDVLHTYLTGLGAEALSRHEE